MNHYHVILVGILVFQNFTTSLTGQTWSLIMHSLHMSPAAAPCTKILSTTQTTPALVALCGHYLQAFFIYVT